MMGTRRRAGSWPVRIPRAIDGSGHLRHVEPATQERLDSFRLLTRAIQRTSRVVDIQDVETGSPCASAALTALEMMADRHPQSARRPSDRRASPAALQHLALRRDDLVHVPMHEDDAVLVRCQAGPAAGTRSS